VPYWLWGGKKSVESATEMDAGELGGFGAGDGRWGLGVEKKRWEER